MRKSEAVLHLRAKDPFRVLSLGQHVFVNMTEHSGLFPSATACLQSLRVESETLSTFINDGNDTKLKREMLRSQTDIVWHLLKELLFHVNQAANGDKVIIFSSGFDCRKEDAPNAVVPSQPVIRRVTDGSNAHSLKVYLGAVPGADRYKLEVATDVSNPVWVSCMDFTNISGLEAQNLERGKEILVRVFAGNSYGWSDPSSSVSFIPR